MVRNLTDEDFESPMAHAGSRYGRIFFAGLNVAPTVPSKKRATSLFWAAAPWVLLWRRIEVPFLGGQIS